MNIKTRQIIDQIELYTSKYIDEITIDDLNNINELIINEFNINDEKEDFYIEDLDYFNNLKIITFNNKIINEEILNYIFKSNIEELNLYNCELVVVINNIFEKIKKLRIEYVDNFKEEYLNLFPNINELSYKGYIINNRLPKNINKLDIMNTTINNINILDNTNINEIFISKEEYENHKDYYSKLIIKVNIYDENNCYLLNSGDKNE